MSMISVTQETGHATAAYKGHLKISSKARAMTQSLVRQVLPVDTSDKTISASAIAFW